MSSKINFNRKYTAPRWVWGIETEINPAAKTMPKFYRLQPRTFKTRKEAREALRPSLKRVVHRVVKLQVGYTVL